MRLNRVPHSNPRESIVENADAATVTFDLSSGTKHAVTLGDNRILAVLGATPGKTFSLRITQDNGGSRTVTWFSTIRWAGGAAPTLTTTGNKTDWFGFVCTGTNTFDGFVIGQNL